MCSRDNATQDHLGLSKQKLLPICNYEHLSLKCPAYFFSILNYYYFKYNKHLLKAMFQALF